MAWTGLAAAVAVEELETELLLEALFQRFGHDFRAWDRVALRERLARALRAHEVGTLSGLQERVLHDAAAASKLLRALAPQAVGLFDNPGHAARLRTLLAPSLRGHQLLVGQGGMDFHLPGQTFLGQHDGQRPRFADAGASPGRNTAW
jgi:chemotaxis protein methyltransferase CheR